MKKFEYFQASRITDMGLDEWDEVMNEYGKDGWEMCGAIINQRFPDFTTYFFKREVIKLEVYPLYEGGGATMLMCGPSLISDDDETPVK